MFTLMRRLALACLIGLLVPASALAVTGPVIVGSVSDATNLSSTVSVAVSGHYAYTTAYQAGELTAVDISNPAAPSIAGHSPSDLHLIGGSNVAIAGGYAFVVSKNRNGPCQPGPQPSCGSGSNDDGNGNSLTILDIHTNPANPAIVGTVRDPNKLFGSYGIAVSGNYAYVAYQGLLSGQPTSPDTSTGGFSVIDISNLSGPTIVANIDNGSLSGAFANGFDHSTSVAISGHYAYVTAFYSATLTVVDISNPTSPQIAGVLHDALNMAFPTDLVVQGNDAYVANQVGGSSDELTVVDLSNPVSPRVVGVLSNAALSGAYRIRVRGSFAYISGSSSNAISAIDISNPSAPRLAGAVSDPNRLQRTTGLDLDSTGAYVISSSPYLTGQSNQIYPPYPLQTGGPPNTGTIAVIALDPTPIAVAIATGSEPPVATTQTSANFTFSVNDAVSLVRCSLDGGAFGACTSQTTQSYSGLGMGGHTFTVQATDATGNPSTASYSWTVGTPPANGGSAPSISGTAVAGHTLSATPGTWSGSPAPSYAYQWLRCSPTAAGCAAIAGAVGSTYAVANADVGHTLVVSVRATNSLGSAAAESKPTAAVPPVASATLGGVGAGKPRLVVSATAGARGAVIAQITIAPPSGLRFASGHALQRAITARDARGHRLAVSVALRGGALIIRLHKAQQVVSITGTSGGLKESSGLRAKARRHRGTPVALGVAIKDRSGHVSRQTLHPGLV